MREIMLNTEIHKFETCAEFAREFALGADDLLFTIRPIYEAHFAPLGLPVKTLFWEDFGSGEPTDVMTDEIIAAASKLGFRRLVAAGGGSIIDIAKAVAVSGGRTTDELYAAAPDIKRSCGLVIAPTTCGTGSEVTNISIINRTRLGTKMGLVAPALFADQCALRRARPRRRVRALAEGDGIFQAALLQGRGDDNKTLRNDSARGP